MRQLLTKLKSRIMKKTIFTGNKKFTDVLMEAILFALGSAVALTIIAGCIIAFINLLN